MKNKGTLILAVIFAFQLVVSLGCLAFGEREKKEFETTSQDFKVRADYFSLNNITAGVAGIFFETEADLEVQTGYGSEDGYILFTEGRDGFAEFEVVDKKPTSGCYVSQKKLYELWKNDGYCDFSYKSDAIASLSDTDVNILYNPRYEEYDINIEAYAVFRVGGNRAEIVDFYINGQSINDIAVEIKNAVASDGEVVNAALFENMANYEVA